jgi:hypothetical protein
MNEANVAALKALLVELLEPGNLSADEIHDLADDLADHGALVAGALTDEQSRSVLFKSALAAPADQLAEDGHWVRSTLERIAKGEA